MPIRIQPQVMILNVSGVMVWGFINKKQRSACLCFLILKIVWRFR